VTTSDTTRQAGPGHAKDLQGVIDSGMCIGCGACVAADGTVSLTLDTSRLSYRPSHASDERAASVCPAVAVDFDMLHEKVFPGKTPGDHGVVEKVLLAQSTDLDRNMAASSGGLIKELLHSYLDTGEVDGVISIVHTGGIDYRPQLITDPAELDRLPGSIYHALPFDDALKILRENEGRFVLIGIPCQFEGIFSYIHKLEPALADRIHTTVGLLCGWQYNHHALRAISRYKGVDPDQLTDVSWRGGGPVGRLRLPTPTKTTTVSRRVDFSYQVAFDRSFNIPRCHLCINHSNFLADIVVGDAWLPSTVYTKSGISLLICRTEATAQRIGELTEAGRIVSADVTVDEITESQTRRVVFGDFAYAYQEYLAQHGLPHPTMTGPNRSAARLHDESVVAEFHEELTKKLAMQQRGEYRRLWLRKATKEFPRLAKRYLDWFLVRILKIKSLTGKRQEVPSDKIRIFR
jgi:coenzyme F420 hydrogenase subunit beta